MLHNSISIPLFSYCFSTTHPHVCFFLTARGRGCGTRKGRGQRQVNGDFLKSVWFERGETTTWDGCWVSVWWGVADTSGNTGPDASWLSLAEPAPNEHDQQAGRSRTVWGRFPLAASECLKALRLWISFIHAISFYPSPLISLHISAKSPLQDAGCMASCANRKSKICRRRLILTLGFPFR